MPSTRPLIGITVDWNPGDELGGKVSLNDGYVRVVVAAGGVPVLIPPWADVETLADTLDGLLIPGGADIDPKHYGAVRHPKTELISEARFEQEWRLLSAFEQRRKPILGICYGCQLLNVWRGGTLHQHLPDLPTVTLTHQRASQQEPYPRHLVQVDTRSKLFESMRLAQFEVVSAHHQAVRDLGRGLVISARASDGVVEAIEDPNLPFLIGVQWHPERDPDAPATRALLTAFVRACKA
ncbi:MAG: gamma-glutamyl-gamma-aminobutyrate hydrolase family protein [Fimbriimonadales bacterium]|nr:gamma-glutamyl-gamma-aminobutyrate hydrolase family protein [Fimbriimonadales bacterium]